MFWGFTLQVSYGQRTTRNIQFDFFGDTISLGIDTSEIVSYSAPLTSQAVEDFYNTIKAGNYQPTISALLNYKEQYHLNDWLYYQLIRKTVQEISPKADNYERYTLYKWFLMAKSGYDATLVMGKKELLIYVKTEENIYDIPLYMCDGKQYVCLNSHDYGKINFNDEDLYEVNVYVPEAQKAFSYKVTQLPDFAYQDYSEKDIAFNYHNKGYHFNVMVNPQVKNIFINYPVVDFESYFNIPLSKKTYNSLIPVLKENLKGMSQKKGVDYLMRFTRNAFLYENDQQNFGKEKRLSPEQTLLYEYSDCDDRVALFFYLVREIYNLPMIVLLYPTHVTIAVKFDKPTGNSIMYKDGKYSVCEPTPQAKNLSVGELSPKLHNIPYQVAYEYNPPVK